MARQFDPDLRWEQAHLLVPTLFDGFENFAAATAKAKELAAELDEEIGVRKGEEGHWVVLASSSTAARLQSQADAEAAWCDDDLPGLDEYYQDEDMLRTQEEIQHDLSSDQNDWARSEEEGWFYSDDD